MKRIVLSIIGLVLVASFVYLLSTSALAQNLNPMNPRNPALSQPRSYSIAELSTLRAGQLRDSDLVQMTVAEFKAVALRQIKVSNMGDPQEIARALRTSPALQASRQQRPLPGVKLQPGQSGQNKPTGAVLYGPVTAPPAVPDFRLRANLLDASTMVSIRNSSTGPDRAEFIGIERQNGGVGPFVEIARIQMTGEADQGYEDLTCTGITFYRVRAYNKVGQSQRSCELGTVCGARDSYYDCRRTP